MAYGTFPGPIFDVKSGYEVRISIYCLCHVLYSDFCEIMVQFINSGIAKDGTVKNDITAVNRWPHISSTWLKRAYINPSSNASDIGKAMNHEGFASKSTFNQ
jgi:hypothetical protein